MTSNEEYLQQLEEQNKMKKDSLRQSRDAREHRKLEDRENGFQIYMQGANEQRVQVNMQPPPISGKKFVQQPNSQLSKHQPVQYNQHSNQNQQLKGARRQWRDPSKSNEKGSLSRSPLNHLNPKLAPQTNTGQYYNPFDLSSQPNQFFHERKISQNRRDTVHDQEMNKSTSHQVDEIYIKANQGPSRKKWASQLENLAIEHSLHKRQHIQMQDVDILDDFEEIKQQSRLSARNSLPTEKGEKNQPNQEESDEDYSADDFEYQDEKDNLHVIHEHINESKDIIDTSVIQDPYTDEQYKKRTSKAEDIHQFLKTATADEMDLVRESLSIFNEASKNFTNFPQSKNMKYKDPKEEDFLEEVYEEEIPEDQEDYQNSDEKFQFEPVKKGQNQASSSHKYVKVRPVSAVYDLSHQKVANLEKYSQKILQGAPSVSALSQGNQNQALNMGKREQLSKYASVQSSSIAMTTRTQKQPKVQKAIHTNRAFQGAQQQSLTAQGNYIQANQTNASINPLKRPFSESKPGLRKPQNQEAHGKYLNTDLNLNLADEQVKKSVKNEDTTKKGLIIPQAYNYNLDASQGAQSYQSKKSDKDAELTYIMQAIVSLDDIQRQDLIKILKNKQIPNIGLNEENMDAKSALNTRGDHQSLGSLQVPDDKSSYLTHKLHRNQSSLTSYTSAKLIQPLHQKEVHVPIRQPDSQKQNLVQQDFNPVRTRNELKIKVISTHGDPHLCGLTEIELFDSTGKKVVLIPSNVIVRNLGRFGQGAGASQLHMSTAPLINGEKFTNEHRNMWIGSLPMPSQPPVFLEILIYFALNADLSVIKIWNYNKSVRDSTKGVRDIEIYLNDSLKYQGIVQMGRGQVNEDYSELINLQNSIKETKKTMHGIEEVADARQEETQEIIVDDADISFSKAPVNSKDFSVQEQQKPQILLHQNNFQSQPQLKNIQNAQPESQFESKNQQNININFSLQLQNPLKQQEKTPQRNIDVIRQRNLNEQSRSRSRSPFDDLSSQKPVWLQPRGGQLADKNQQTIFQNTDETNSKNQIKQEKLNRRQQAELMHKQNQSKMMKQNSEKNSIFTVYDQKPSEHSLFNNQQKEKSFIENQEIGNKYSGFENQNLEAMIPQHNEKTQKSHTKPFEEEKLPDWQKDDHKKSVKKLNIKEDDVHYVPYRAQLVENQIPIEESLDSLDLFKVTNLGRINNDRGQQNSQQRLNQRSSALIDIEKNKRLKCESQNQLELQDTCPYNDQKQDYKIDTSDLKNLNQPLLFKNEVSESSQNIAQTGKDANTRGGFKAPKVMKTPFPDEFCLPSPSLSSNKKSASRVSVKREKEGTNQKLKIQECTDLNDIFNDLCIENPMQKTNITKKLQEEELDALEYELKAIGSNQNLDQGQNAAKLKIEKKEVTFSDKLNIFKEKFIIPNLPQGRKIEFNILQTWGDINYLGLTGIEVFDEEGNQIKIRGDTDIQASPSDINLLMGQGTDPRTVDKLVDGVYFTNDDFHAWLTPFTQGEDHTITIQLPMRTKISMIRIWNYNKSRIHSFRGARLLTCKLDEKLIYKGEIAKAPGNTIDPASCCEIILLTDDDSILNKIDSNDWLNKIQLQNQSDQDDCATNTCEQERPMTATKRFGQEEIEELQFVLGQITTNKQPTSMFDERPQTKAIRRGIQNNFQQNDYFDINDNKPNNKLEEFKPQIMKKTKNKRKERGVKGRLIEFNITESWGDLFYVGLNGIEIIGENQEKIKINLKNLDAKPRDMNSIPNNSQDHRTLDKLINGINNTADDKNMWLIPFNMGDDHFIKVDLGRFTTVCAVKFYNYNKSPEDSLRGVKLITIKIDGKLVSPAKGVLVRKAPGFILEYDNNMCNDIGQAIYLPYADGWKSNQIMPFQRQISNQNVFGDLIQEYETQFLPIGFTFRINFYSTHGDNYYIGLNGIELFDQLNNIIPINPEEEVMADPASVNRIIGMEKDQRTLQKLFDGVNSTFDDRHMWLAPFKFTRSHAAANCADKNSYKRDPNFISLIFEQPKAISAIKLWNYSKTPSRGVHEFEIVVDDKPIYRGFIKKAPENDKELSHLPNRDFSTVVLFTNDSQIIRKHKGQINYESNKSQDVLMFNERKQVNEGKVKERPNEKFVFNEIDRPTTKYGRESTKF